MELMYKLWQRAELGDRKRGKRSRPSRRLTGAGNYSPGAAGRSCAGKAPGNLRVGAPELLSGRQPNSRRWCEPPKAERRQKSCSTEPRAPREPGAKRVPPAGVPGPCRLRNGKIGGAQSGARPQEWGRRTPRTDAAPARPEECSRVGLNRTK